MNPVLVGIGGASCSGKSTLAQRLQTILDPVCHVFILRQDCFFKPTESIAKHPVTQQVNWELPSSLDFDQMINAIHRIRNINNVSELGALWTELNLGYDAQDHMRPSTAGSVDLVRPGWWPSTLLPDNDVPYNKTRIVILVDGFLLFYHSVLIQMLDCFIFLAADFNTCESRRLARSGYACVDGVFWTDPPGYFNDYVWPAYLKYNHSILQLLPSWFTNSTNHPAVTSSALPHQFLKVNYASSPTSESSVHIESVDRLDVLCIDARMDIATTPAYLKATLDCTVSHIMKLIAQ